MTANPDNILDVTVPRQFTAQRVNYGRGYLASHIFTGVAAGGGIADLYIRNLVDLQMHCDFIASVSDEATGELFESPTVTANGTQLNVENMHRESAILTQNQIFHTPTVTSPGAPRLAARKLHGPVIASIYAVPGSELNSAKFVLARATQYLFRVTNDSGAAQNISMQVLFYDDSIFFQ